MGEVVKNVSVNANYDSIYIQNKKFKKRTNCIGYNNIIEQQNNTSTLLKSIEFESDAIDWKIICDVSLP